MWAGRARAESVASASQRSCGGEQSCVGEQVFGAGEDAAGELDGCVADRSSLRWEGAKRAGVRGERQRRPNASRFERAELGCELGEQVACGRTGRQVRSGEHAGVTE